MVLGFAVLLGVGSAACDTADAGGRTDVRVIDLLPRFGLAERRPEHGDFSVAQHTLAGQMRASIGVPANSRLIWTTRLPRRSTLRVAAGLPPSPQPAQVRFRIGVSDHRIYDRLVERIVGTDDRSRGWIPLEADLRLYAGLQWSVFYRPEGRPWRLVLSTDLVSGHPVDALWADPRVEADAASARRFVRDYPAR